MATVADLLVRIEANTQQMRNELRKGEGIVNNFDKRVNRAALSSSSALSRIGRSAQATIGILAGLGVSLGVAEIATGIAQVNAQFQDLQTSLKVATGSATAADQAFAGLRVFAKETPFQLSEVTQAFISLKNLGLDPSMEALRAYGDIASSFNGKSLDDFIQAVADATTGEFERLKEFGIKASSEGENVAFTFRGLTTTIGKNAAEIERYLQDLARNNFGGAMSEKMDNLSGRFSNLKDAVDDLYVTIGESGGIDVMAGALEIASGAVVGLTDNLEGVADVLALVGAAAAGRFLAPLVTSMGAAGASAAMATISFLRMQAALPQVANASRVAAAGMLSLGVAARGAGVAMAFLGGPVGAAITVLSGAVYLLSTRQSQAEQAAEDHKLAMERLNVALGDGTKLSSEAAGAARQEAQARISAAQATLEQLEAQRKVNEVAEQMAAEAPIQSPFDPKLDLTSDLDRKIEAQKKRLEELRDVLAQLNGDVPVSGGSGSGGTGGGGGSDKAADQIKRVIENLKFQEDQLGRTAREQAIYNALQQAGIDGNHSQAAVIRELAGSYYDTKKAIKDMTSAADAQIEARADIDQSIEALKLENRLLQVQGVEREKLRAILEAEATAREGGIELSEQQRQQIEDLIDANERLKTAEDQAAEAARDARQFARDFGNVISTGFEDAILSGEKLGDVLKSLEKDIARIIMRMAVTKPLENAVGGLFGGIDFGGIFGSLFGGGVSASAGYGQYASSASGAGILNLSGARANGGPVTAGKAYLVGEKGPEPFIPSVSGTILPNSSLSAGGGESFTYAPNITIDARNSTMSPAEFRAIVKTAVDGSVAEVRSLQRRKGNARI
ncbi:tape measure protein [Thalassospira sp. UBA1131]|uniref:tape measure protein n=1 Tax=Thalassospira sp. UBA1131 TaxID=1947672 RepID=UPI0025ED6909|nr:tape measure protein [Thalassospira sp. UBA1131]